MDSSSSDYKTESDKESLSRQFAIGEGSDTPKKEPSINEVYSSDEEMNYVPPRQETPTKQFASKLWCSHSMTFPLTSGMTNSTSFMHG